MENKRTEHIGTLHGLVELRNLSLIHGVLRVAVENKLHLRNICSDSLLGLQESSMLLDGN